MSGGTTLPRLEGFSDAVFGFALTLLVVSLEVPRSYEQLMDLLRGFPSFACCFVLLLWLWHEHNVFFRRYGLQDGVTVLLNGGLLFMILLYVYPLKFMFDSLFARFIPTSRPPVNMERYQLANASSVYATTRNATRSNSGSRTPVGCQSPRESKGRYPEGCRVTPKSSANGRSCATSRPRAA